MFQLFNPFLWRQVVEAIRRVGGAKPPKDRVTEAPRVVENWADTWKGGRTRKLSEIRRIVVHQTAVEFGVSRRLLKKHGGDRKAARRERFKSVPYHVIFTLDGEALLIHPLERWTYHAKGAPNRNAVGVAFEGLFPATEDKRRPKHTVLPDGVFDAWVASAPVVWLRLVAQIGSEVPVVTHRQCSRVKVSDPGELVMRVVNSGFGAHDRSWTRAGGRPQPEKWIYASAGPSGDIQA